jgi:DNA topoisomerase-1
MNPAVYDQTGVDIEAKASGRTYGLRASGSVLRIPGWKAVYGQSAEPLAGEEVGADEAEMEEGTLPELRDGEQLTIVVPPGVNGHHKKTEPPPYFNEASLVKKLEEEGIGRPSTYAEIISKVQARDYVRKSGAKLVPTELGKLVIVRLVADEFDLADIGFTRKLEDDLDAVAEARVKRLDVLKPFHDRLQKQIEHALEKKGKWWPDPEPLEEKCPECGGELVKRWGRNGPFIGCTQYPECKYTRNIPQEGEDGVPEDRQPTLTDYVCDKCGSKMMKRWGRNGWFLGCSSFPKCKNTSPVPLGIKCPKCKTGDIIEVRARGRGRPFYGCTNYQSEQKCDFRLFQKPVIQPCPNCGAEFMVRGGNKEDPTLKCSNPTCSYEGPWVEPEEPAAAGSEGEGEDKALRPTGTHGKSEQPTAED